jgi:hypothetical protein
MKISMPSLLLFILGQCFGFTTFGDEGFDFGEEGVEVANYTEEAGPSWGSYFRGEINFGAGYQLGAPERFIDIGPSVFSVYERDLDFASLYFEGDYSYNHAYRLEDDSSYVQSHFQDLFNLRELYAKKAMGATTASIGKQMVVWTTADLLPVVDVFTAIDQSKYYFANPSETRFGLLGLKIDHYLDFGEINFWGSILAHKDRLADESHPYSQTGGLKVESEIQDNEIEYGVRFLRKFHKGSVAVLGGNVHQRIPVRNVSLIDGSVTDSYNQYSFAGLTFEKIFWNVLIKAEYIHKSKIQTQEVVNGTYAHGPLVSDDTIMMGVDYNHQRYGSFIFEVSYDHRYEFKNRNIYGDGDTLWGAISWGQDFLSEDLKLGITGMFIKSLKNRLLRIDSSYKLNDDFSIGGQISIFSSDSSNETLAFIKNLDRIDLFIKYNF